MEIPISTTENMRCEDMLWVSRNRKDSGTDYTFQTSKTIISERDGRPSFYMQQSCSLKMVTYHVIVLRTTFVGEEE